MKSILSISGGLMLFLLVTASACSTSNKSQTEEVSKTGPEYTSAYICPMHCKGSGSDQPGNCPVCDMPYKENSDYEAQTASEEIYSCPMHSEITGQAGDSCSICHMALVPTEAEQAPHDHDHDHQH